MTQDECRTSSYRYDLPPELIAQAPVDKRDQSRLMVLHRQSGELEHRVFHDIISYLNPGDVLVVNESKVIPARLFGLREKTGAHIEILLLKQEERDCWEALARPGRRVKTGEWLSFGDGKLRAMVAEQGEEGIRLLRFFYEGEFYALLDELGEMPLPPYIHSMIDDPLRYQTVYAREKGSAAAPTAGVHFTEELLKRISDKGVIINKVLLHVGLGTFRPVGTTDIRGHKMHAEYFEISEQTARSINAARHKGNRIFAVGTTIVRVLESSADENGTVCAKSGWTRLFIYPGVPVRVVDALVTNFHLPESTLLMLISAFAGRENVLGAYREAVSQKYRFFSFGDAMLIVN